MSTLDDFFGDSETAVKECLHCGEGEEIAPLIVAVSDVNGPTHWQHEDCKTKADEEREQNRPQLSPTWDEAMSETG